jgi:hypothetical protein
MKYFGVTIEQKLTFKDHTWQKQTGFLGRLSKNFIQKLNFWSSDMQQQYTSAQR